MTNYFYADCTIKNISMFQDSNGYYSADIDGRRVENLRIDEKMKEYLCGIGKNTKNRIWFAASGKSLVAISIANSAGEKYLRKDSTAQNLSSLIAQPVAIGGIMWFLTWVILFLPSSMFPGRAGDKLDTLNTIAIIIGLISGFLYFLKTAKVVKKLSNLDTWPEGNIADYSTVIFGSGLAEKNKSST